MFLFMKPKTVDGVLSAFRRVISDLRAVGEERAEACNTKNQIARDLQAEADVDAAEADRAFTLASKFEQAITV
jgi:hypothetical protein